MIEPKVIEKFMEDNGLEPYDAFDVDGELKKYSPCYFTEELELRSMYLDFEGVDLPLCTIWLHRLLTGKDHVKQKRTKDNNSEVVAEEKRNVVCKVSVKGYVISDEELDYTIHLTTSREQDVKDAHLRYIYRMSWKLWKSIFQMRESNVN